MNSRQRNITSIFLAVATIAFVFYLYQDVNLSATNPVYLVLFAVLLTYTTTFGIPIGGGEVSLVPLVAISSMIVLGPFPTSLAMILSDLVFGLLRLLFKERVGWKDENAGFSLTTATAANITMHVLSISAAWSVFNIITPHVPLKDIWDFTAMSVVGATYIAANYLAASLFMRMLSKAHFIYLWQNLRQMLIYEFVPLLFSPLIAVTLTDLGVVSFIGLATVLMIFAGILRDQAKSHTNLERRIQEISSLQIVGKTLSTSLDINEITTAIYNEVSKLMPASNFHLAIYNSETEEVSFPTAYENDQRVHWSPRAAGNGITEYVIKTKQPLLIPNNVRAKVESLGITHYGDEAYSWLGVPILAGDESIGMIAVQSYPIATDIPQSFDISHQTILTTIAAQASVAIQNARLYAQTDEALARRVQQLNSILSTASEGILLLDTHLNVLEVNRALAKMLNTTPANLLDNNLAQAENDILKELRIEKDLLEPMLAGELDSHQAELERFGPYEIPVEQTVTPVRGDENNISGWLFVYRDLTEEHELERFQTDMMRMLVHDLRSPIVAIQGGLDMIEVLIDDYDKETLLEMLDISRSGSYLILSMINQILNINKLESGQIHLHLEPLAIPTIFNEERNQFKSILGNANLTITGDFGSDLPVIEADRDLLTRILHNLLDNAIKFSKDGDEITVWGKPDPHHVGYIQIGVSDQGIGIPKNIHAALFEKYFTSQQEKSRRKGTGLGLYFCKLAVEAHGGEIWVESEVDQGSNFIIRIPVENKQEIA